MLGNGVTIRDSLLVLAIVVPVGALVGAALGLYSNYFELSNGLRVLIIVAFCGLAGRIGQKIVLRRVKARSASKRMT